MKIVKGFNVPDLAAGGMYAFPEDVQVVFPDGEVWTKYEGRRDGTLLDSNTDGTWPCGSQVHQALVKAGLVPDTLPKYTPFREYFKVACPGLADHGPGWAERVEEFARSYAFWHGLDFNVVFRDHAVIQLFSKHQRRVEIHHPYSDMGDEAWTETFPCLTLWVD